MMRNTNTHQPAMSPQEAAMLPAIVPANPGNLVMPRNECHFVSVTAARESVARQGSPAGRAVLRAAGVNLPGVSRMGCAGRRRVQVEMDCEEV